MDGREPLRQRLYQIKGELDATGIYLSEETARFCEIYFKPKQKQSVLDHQTMNAALDPAVSRFTVRQRDDESEAEEWREKLPAFRNLYGFLCQVIPYQDSDLERLYVFLRHLAAKLPRRKSGTAYQFDDDVRLEYYRLQKISEGSISLRNGTAQRLDGPTEVGSGMARPQSMALSQLIDVVNERFGTDFNQADQLFFDQIVEAAMADEGLRQAAAVNPSDKFELVFKHLLESDASAALDLREQTSNAKATFNVQAEVDAELDINLIFTHIHVGGTIDIRVSSGNYAAPNAPPYPLNAITIQHPLVRNTWPLAVSPTPTVDGMAGGQPAMSISASSPTIVPPDGLPTVTFSVPMNDATGLNQNIPTNGLIAYGNAEYQFTLQSVTIEQLDGNGNSQVPPAFVSGVVGKWSALNGTYTLQIWADTPGAASSLLMTLPSNRLADQQAILGPAPCAPISYTPATVCAPMSDSPEVQLGSSYEAIPPGATFDGVTMDDSWKVAQDQPSGVRVVLFCPLASLSFGEPVGVITVRTGTWLEGYPVKPLVPTFCAAPAGSGSGPTTSAGVGPFALLDSNNIPVAFTQTMSANTYTLNCPSGASVLQALQGITISEVCYITMAELQKQQAASQANAAKQAALNSGASAAASSNPTLLPWTQYRIVVTTQVAGQQNGQPLSSIPSVSGSFLRSSRIESPISGRGLGSDVFTATYAE